MDQPISLRRREAIKAYTDAFDAVAWRAPSPRRFDGRPANDHGEYDTPMPGWVVPVVGALAAAIMGLLLGGALAL